MRIPFFSKNKDTGEHLEKFFNASLSFRSSVRKGAIVVFEDGFDMSNFLRAVSWQEGYKTEVVRVSDLEGAKALISEIGADNVKTVVIDGDKIEGTLNGQSLIGWLSKNHHQIPVWIGNCKDPKKQWIKDQTHRFGIFSMNEPVKNIIKCLGFSDKCLEGVGNMRYRCLYKI